MGAGTLTAFARLDAIAGSDEDGSQEPVVTNLRQVRRRMPPTIRTRRSFVALAALMAPISVGLAPTALSATVAHDSLPPAARAELVSIFGPKVKRFGLRVTRAALVDAKQRRNAHGTHLAIYVEPTGAYTVQDYLDGTVDVSRVFLPYVFERWKDLRSFDVCQEPHPRPGDSLAPYPQTQIYATRTGSKMIDWSTVDVATLIARSDVEAAATGPTGAVRFSVYIAKQLTRDPAYQSTVGEPQVGDTPMTPAYG